MENFPVGIKLPDGVMFYIGNFVACWGRLEAVASVAITTIAHRDNDTGRCVTAQMDMRDKLHSLKALVALKYNVASKKERKHLEQIEKWINYCLGTLIPLRNRIIHDQWDEASTGPYEVIRRRPQATVSKPQSRQRELVFSEETTITAVELMAYCQIVENACWTLGMLILIHIEGNLPKGFTVAPIPSQ